MRGSEAGRLVVMLAPETARYLANQPLERRAGGCRFIALQVLRAAREKGKERIRVMTPGCECEFGVAQLAAHIRPKLPYMGSLVRSGSVRNLLRLGDTFEERAQMWPGVALTPPRLAEGA